MRRRDGTGAASKVPLKPLEFGVGLLWHLFFFHFWLAAIANASSSTKATANDSARRGGAGASTSAYLSVLSKFFVFGEAKPLKRNRLETFHLSKFRFLGFLTLNDKGSRPVACPNRAGRSATVDFQQWQWRGTSRSVSRLMVVEPPWPSAFRSQLWRCLAVFRLH